MKMNHDDFRRIRYSPAEFRRFWLIDTPDGLRPLADAMDDWQAKDFAGTDPSWMAAVGHRIADANRFAYLERPRGHSKTSDQAVSIAWALTCATRPVIGAVFAGDQEQGRLIVDAVARGITLNPHLRLSLEVQQNRIINVGEGPAAGSQLRIIPADVGTAFGLLLDFAICDELTNWPDGRGEEMFSVVASTMPKRPNSFLAICSNAGWGQGSSWQWRIYDEARTSPDWYFSSQPGVVASWMLKQPGFLDKQRKLISPKEFDRVWQNRWVTESGEYLSSDEIMRAIKSIDRHNEPQPGIDCYVGGLDYSVRRDHSAFVVIGVDSRLQKFHVAEVLDWIPARMGGEVCFEAMRREIAAACTRLNVWGIAYDEFQAAETAQRLAAYGLQMIRWDHSPASMDYCGRTLVNAFKDDEVVLYRHERLIDDLHRLIIVEGQRGLRLEAKRDREKGHCDRGYAFAYALAQAKTMLNDWLIAAALEPEYEEYVYT